MAATGKTPILLYGSTTATNAPIAGNLTNSSDGCEIAINVADKNLFFKDSTNAVNTVPIRQSSGSSDGWLSSTNWTTFNSKQTAYTNLTSIGNLANATGWLYNNGSGTFTYSTPTASDVGAVPTTRTVSTTSPLAGGGALSSNLTLSITQATTSTSGYLSSTDWNTFNNKQPAGTYVTSVTGTAPVVSSGGTIPAISMAAATGSVNGYLTSTDWTTFNSKQAALVSGTNIKTVSGTTLLGSGDLGTIGVGYGGTGTATTFTAGSVVFAGASGVYTQDNANLFWDDTNNRLGIGVATPAKPLHVQNGAVAGAARGGATTKYLLETNGDQYLELQASATSTTNDILFTRGNSGAYGIVGYDNTNNELKFYANSAKKMGISSAGDVTVSVGNLVIGTSGKGIDVSVTSQAAGMTSELLADYEEGLHTTTITCGTSGTITLSSSGDTLQYVKIGNLVTVSGDLSVSSVSSPTGYFSISLPYTVATLSEYAAYVPGICVITPSVSNANGYAVTTGNGSTTAIVRTAGLSISNNSAQQVAAGADIYFSITYRTA